MATRDRDRRQKIVDAARRLFREQTFQSVSINDIGAAAGITGPGLYRYFSSKEELLAEAMHQSVSGIWPTEDNRIPVPPGLESDPAARLEAHVDFHLAYLAENGDLVELWYAERHHLPDEFVANRTQTFAAYEREWLEVVRAARPDLGEREVVTRAHAAFGLLESIARHPSAVPFEAASHTLRRMALAALYS